MFLQEAQHLGARRARKVPRPTLLSLYGVLRGSPLLIGEPEARAGRKRFFFLKKKKSVYIPISTTSSYAR